MNSTNSNGILEKGELAAMREVLNDAKTCELMAHVGIEPAKFHQALQALAAPLASQRG